MASSGCCDHRASATSSLLCAICTCRVSRIPCAVPPTTGARAQEQLAGDLRIGVSLSPSGRFAPPGRELVRGSRLLGDSRAGGSSAHRRPRLGRRRASDRDGICRGWCEVIARVGTAGPRGATDSQKANARAVGRERALRQLVDSPPKRASSGPSRLDAVSAR